MTNQNWYTYTKGIFFHNIVKGTEKLGCFPISLQGCERLDKAVFYTAVPLGMETSPRLLLPGSQTKSWAKVLYILRCAHISGDATMASLSGPGTEIP